MIRLLFPLMIVTVILFAGSLSGADWPQWRGPDENGIAREKLEGTVDLENVAWRKEIGIGFSSIAVAGDRVFTMGHDGRKVAGKETVWCLEAATGAEIWSDTYEAALLPNLHEGGPSATPTVEGEQVFTLSKDGRLHAYEIESGKRVWQRNVMEDAGMKRPPEWGFAGSPYVLGDLLLIEAGSTFAFRKATGELVWRSDAFRPAYGSPVAFEHAGKIRIATLKTDGLVILDAETGTTLAFEKWETAFQTNASTPLIDGNLIFISTGYDRGCALFEFTGEALEKRYENQSLCNHMNNSVLIGGHLYGFDGTAHRGRPTEFVCLELASGKEKWRVKPDEGLFCGSVIGTADDQLVILSERGELLVAEATPERFSYAARAQVLGGRCWTPPALANGRIYCRNARGDLVCVVP